MCCSFCAYNIYLMQVYYVPVWVVYNQCTFPTLFTTFPLIRYILLREEINIVHGHSVCIFFYYIHNIIYFNKVRLHVRFKQIRLSLWGELILILHILFIFYYVHLLLTFYVSFYPVTGEVKK